MIISSTRVRPFARTAVLLAVIVLAAACSDESGPAAGGSPTTAPSSESTAPDTSGPDTSATVDAEVTVVDLPAAIAALDAGYHFVATVRLNGQISLEAAGDRVGAASRLEITSSGATVSYVITPEGNYAKPADGEWERLDVTPATSDPIAALHTPVSVSPGGKEGAGMRLTVTVTATSLGITAEGNVAVDVVVVDGAITEVRYSAAVEGGTAEVVTVISPLADTTPITAPI
jgi:hypothetical protein